MGEHLNLALAHGVLAISSVWSLLQCLDLKFARVAFCLYLVNGILGVVDYVLRNEPKGFKKVLHAVPRWSRPLYLPLIAADAIVYAGFSELYAICHLIFPAIYLFLTELLNKHLKKEYLDLSTIGNTISLCFSAFTKQDIFGGVCAVLNLGTFLGTQYNSMEYLLLIAISNIAAVQFFKQFF